MVQGTRGRGVQLIELPEPDTKPRYLWTSIAVSVVATALAVAIWQLSFSLSIAILATGVGNGLRLFLQGAAVFVYHWKAGEAELVRSHREQYIRLVDLPRLTERSQ